MATIFSRELNNLATLKTGMTARVYQKIKEKDTKGKEKERVQIFEGIVIARKGGNQTNATFTIRKIADGGIGVERIFPLFSPFIEKIELVSEYKTRREKLY